MTFRPRMTGIRSVFLAVAGAGLLAVAAVAPASAADVAATIQGFQYQPNPLTVKVGDKVTWTNNDSAPHTITSDTGVTPAFDTGNIAGGASGSLTFSTAGTFAFHCTVHPNMKATIVVQAPSTPGTGSGLAGDSGAAFNTTLLLLGSLLVLAGGAGAVAVARRS